MWQRVGLSIIIAVFILATTVGTSLAAISLQNGSDTPATTELEGRIARIDSLDAATTQLVLALPIGATVTLNLTPESQILVNDGPGDVSRVGPGARARAKFDGRTGDVLELQVWTLMEMEGWVRAVDMATGRITLTDKNGNEQQVHVNNLTQLDMRTLFLALLQFYPSLELRATYDLSTGDATRLEVK